MARISFATMDDIEAAPNTQARKFHHPAKKPTNLEYLGAAVNEAQ